MVVMVVVMMVPMDVVGGASFGAFVTSYGSMMVMAMAGVQHRTASRIFVTCGRRLRRARAPTR
jgi:energy-converting hydrogenase Eha subunit B